MSETLKSLVIELIGTYIPNTYTLDGEYDIIPAGASGLDWPWIVAALLFGLSFYCVFRLVGVIINAIRNE